MVFNDGTTKTGLGRLSGIDKIKFKTDKKSKASKYHFTNLDKVIIGEGEDSSTYKYIKVDIETYKVLKEVSFGKVSLYTQDITGYSNGAFVPTGFGGGMWIAGGSSYQIKDLFVQRTEDEMATHLGSNQLFSKNFKKAASEYFSDCPNLVQKIKDKEYKKKDIKEIVVFYNNQCDSVDVN